MTIQNFKKIKVKIGIIGFLPFDLSRKLIEKWKSDVFEIVGGIEEYHFRQAADMNSWGYSDALLEEHLPKNIDADFFIGITYAPIEDNYYARRLISNRIVLSYFEMYNILKQEHIPMKNLLLRMIYRYILVYLKNNKKIPSQIQQIRINDHDDVRGCIFDFNGNKENIIYSLDKPKICDGCIEEMRKDRVADNYINQVEKEIQRIRRERFYNIIEFIKIRPIFSIMLSGLFGVSLNIIATLIYEFLKYLKHFLGM